MNWFELPPFESVGLDTIANVVLQKRERPGVIIATNGGVSPEIKVHVQQNRLYVCDRPIDGELHSLPTLYVSYTRQFCALVVHNSGAVSCRNPIRSIWFGVVQNGKGNINLDLDVFLLDATVTKSGGLTLSGFAEAAVLRNHKGGNLDGRKLETTSATVEVFGSGSVSIHVEDDFRANILGAGDILYKGQPRLKAISVAGTGRIKPLINNFEDTFYGKEKE